MTSLAERLILPLVDVLQSWPVLGFPANDIGDDRADHLASGGLIGRLQEALEASPRGEVAGDSVLELLNEQFTRSEAAAVFGTLVSWTRSCRLLRYNREQDVFRLTEVGGDD